MKLDKYSLGNWIPEYIELEWPEELDFSEFLDKNEFYNSYMGTKFGPYINFYNHKTKKGKCIVAVEIEPNSSWQNIFYLEDFPSKMHFLKEYKSIFEEDKNEFISYGSFFEKKYINKNLIKEIKVDYHDNGVNAIIITDESSCTGLFFNASREYAKYYLYENFRIQI
jgi:hypothetical protein